MTTPPLPASVTSKLRATHQAVRWQATLHELRQFRAHCCNINSAGIMGVSKNPVVRLRITPNPVCLGSPVQYSMAGSYAPGSSIVGYHIAMGDGAEYTSVSGSHTYTAAGTYTVTATVTEGLGKTATIQREVVVRDCSVPIYITFAYVGTDGAGVRYIDFTNATPAWEARNAGLDGNALYVRDLRLRPGHERLRDAFHELWLATKGGVYRSLNGGRTWYRGVLPDPSNAEFNDDPPASVTELDWHCVVFDPMDANTVYVLASKASAGRLWVYKTTDLGASWVSRGVI